MRLYCLPCAGGTAASFSAWPRCSAGLEVEPVEYPGRGRRWGEPPCAALDELVEDLEARARPARDEGEPYALLGHSFGAYVAVALARFLQEAGGPAPARIVVVAASAPHVARREHIHDLPDEEFLQRVQRFGGLPEEALASAELLELMLPGLRADFRILEQDVRREVEPLMIPISVFGGLQDTSVSAPELLAWSQHTTKSFRCRFYAGGHFFLYDRRGAMLADVERDLGAAPSPAPTG